jgi:hypothetical protein
MLGDVGEFGDVGEGVFDAPACWTARKDVTPRNAAALATPATVRARAAGRARRRRSVAGGREVAAGGGHGGPGTSSARISLEECRSKP